MKLQAKEFAKWWHEACEEEAPKQDPPIAMLPWGELPEKQRRLKTAIAAKVLKRLANSATENEGDSR